MVEKNEKKIKKLVLQDTYRPLHVWNTSRNKAYVESLKEHGIESCKGCWSSSEVEQLQENMNNYQEMNPGVEIYKVFYERGIGINRKILQNTSFWDVISYNLCRTLTNISSHMTYMFQDKFGFIKGLKMKNLVSKNLLKNMEKIGLLFRR